MGSRQEKFIKDLAALFKYHGVSIDDFPEYDGNEEYAGTTYYISGNDIFIDISDLEKEIRKWQTD